VKYINIEKNLIPYRFNVQLADEMFTFEIQHNADYDFFTVDLEKNGEVLVVGEKVVYGTYLFQNVADRRYPKVGIMPYDESNNSTAATWETLGKSVFLFVEGN
jgi:hypothetical protein